MVYDVTSKPPGRSSGREVAATNARARQANRPPLTCMHKLRLIACSAHPKQLDETDLTSLMMIGLVLDLARSMPGLYPRGQVAAARSSFFVRDEKIKPIG